MTETPIAEGICEVGLRFHCRSITNFALKFKNASLRRQCQEYPEPSRAELRNEFFTFRKCCPDLSLSPLMVLPRSGYYLLVELVRGPHSGQAIYPSSESTDAPAPSLPPRCPAGLGERPGLLRRSVHLLNCIARPGSAALTGRPSQPHTHPLARPLSVGAHAPPALHASLLLTPQCIMILLIQSAQGLYPNHTPQFSTVPKVLLPQERRAAVSLSRIQESPRAP